MTGIARRTVLAAASLGLAAPAALAQAPLPSRPVTVVVPFSTGGSVDAVMRVLKPHLEQAFGQPVVMDYRPGGATAVGAATVARARPDGHTIGIVIDAFTVNPSLYRNLPYDTLADLAPVTKIGTMPLVVTVNAGGPYATLVALMEAARARPNAVSYATVGVGSMNHLAAEMLARTAGAQMTHVPYRGGGPAVTDLLGRHVDMMVMSLTLARPHLDSGGLRALAVTSEQRAPGLPEVPTVIETGIGHVTAEGWQGVVAPAGTPAEIVQRLHRDFAGVLRLPPVREALGTLGVVIAAATPEDFGAFLRADIAAWARLVRDANIQAE